MASFKLVPLLPSFTPDPFRVVRQIRPVPGQINSSGVPGLVAENLHDGWRPVAPGEVLDILAARELGGWWNLVSFLPQDPPVSSSE